MYLPGDIINKVGIFSMIYIFNMNCEYICETNIAIIQHKIIFQIIFVYLFCKKNYVHDSPNSNSQTKKTLLQIAFYMAAVRQLALWYSEY